MNRECAGKDLTEKIIGAAIEVHRVIGPGLKEEVYESALVVELGLRGIRCRRQVPVACHYKGVRIDEKNHPKAIDLLVEDSIIVECKAVATAKDPIFRAQCLTYMRMTGKQLGLVINFGRQTLVEGVMRVINAPLDGNVLPPTPIGHVEASQNNSVVSA